MSTLIRQQRHFLQLFVHTSPTQRNALLSTVTKDQVKALSQIAHNIIQGVIHLNAIEKKRLVGHRRLVHLLGKIKLGYKHKQRLVRNKQRVLTTLVAVALNYLEPVL